jgi:hypothetical protein
MFWSGCHFEIEQPSFVAEAGAPLNFSWAAMIGFNQISDDHYITVASRQKSLRFAMSFPWALT